MTTEHVRVPRSVTGAIPIIGWVWAIVREKDDSNVYVGFSFGEEKPKHHQEEGFRYEYRAVIGLDEACSALESFATSLPAAVPPGFVLVPVEPTDEMRLAGIRPFLECLGDGVPDGPRSVYKAMLAAAAQASKEPE